MIFAIHETFGEKICIHEKSNRVLFENRPAIYFSNYKENKINNTRMLDTLFIMLAIDIMKQYLK